MSHGGARVLGHLRAKGGHTAVRPEEQEAFDLFVGGMTMADVARRYGVGVGTARTWIHKIEELRWLEGRP